MRRAEGPCLLPLSVPGPRLRRHHRAVGTYDGTNPLFFDDLWLYNATELEWERLFPKCLTCNPSGLLPDGTPVRDKVGPRGRLGTSMAITGSDAAGWYLYLFGGFAFGGASDFKSIYPAPDYVKTFRNPTVDRHKFYPSLTYKVYLNDLWRYDLALNTWEQIQPNPKYPQFPVPSPRHSHVAAMSINQADAIMMLFGGYTWDDEVGDLWQYNISSNVWLKIVDPTMPIPSRRYKPIMVPVGQNSYDTTGTGQQSGRMLLSGGHGCLKGADYVTAAQETIPNTVTALGTFSGWNSQFSLNANGSITVHGNYLDPVTGLLVKSATPDLWIQTPTPYGEKYCMEELNDLWQYFPSSCPNDCTRHGVCNYNSCICDRGFTGYDCSNITCPKDSHLNTTGLSNCVYDYVTHTQTCTQCSGAGVCNGLTGDCTCFYPASGVNCGQFSCLNNCNGNGQCLYNKKITSGPNKGYGTCKCNLNSKGLPAYTGDDCSIPICPTNPSAPAPSAPLPTSPGAVCNGVGTCQNGNCVCFPGFGDSFINVIYIPDPVNNPNAYMKIPAYVDNSTTPATITPSPGCGYNPALLNPWNPGAIDPAMCANGTTYVNDCGEILFVLGAAPSRPAAGAARLLLLPLVVCFALLGTGAGGSHFRAELGGLF